MTKFLRPVLLCFLVLSSTFCYAQAPNISYSTPQTYTVGTAIIPLSPVNSGGAVSANGYSVTPSLPFGLVLDGNTGTISGKPQTAKAATDYTISAVNQSGGSSTVLNITINIPQPPNISYGGNSNVYTTAVSISPLGPVNTGGAAAIQSPVVFATGVYSGAGLAIDAAGNIYASDISKMLIEKYPAGGGAPAIIGSGFSVPSGIAIDGAGNIFVSDYEHLVVKKIPAAGGPPVAFGSGQTYPTAIAADYAGNVYIRTTNGYLLKISANGSQTTNMNYSGTHFITGIAADAAGNLYVTDAGDNTLKEILVNNPTAVTLASGLKNPGRPFIDASGDIYFIDENGTAIKRLPAGGGTPVVVYSSTTLTGFVFDAAGNLYFTDQTNTIKFVPKGGYHISPDLSAGLSLDHNTGVISGTPTATSPATDYTITAYNAGGSSSATVNIAVNHYPFPQVSYPGPNVYSLNRPINPSLTPASTNVAASGNYVVRSVATGSVGIPGLAVDASGNAYVAVPNKKTVVKIPADGSASVVIASGFVPAGLAIDKLNNIYVVDYSNYAVKKIPANGSAIVNIAPGLNQPYGLAIDAVGNLYVTILGDGSIQKIPAGGGSPITLTPHFTQPRGVAVDLSGNVYITDPADGVIKKIPADNTGLAIPLASSSSQPYGVAVDGKGNVFFTEKTGTSIKEIPAGTNTVTSVISSLAGALSLATDSKNGFYVGNATNFTSFTPPGGYFITQALPPGLQFDNSTGAISGTPTALSPATDYTITAYNQGGSTSTTTNIQVVYNAGLTKLALSAGTLNPGFASTTTDYSTIVPNAIASIKLTPTAVEKGGAITVNGAPVTSGTASASLPLAVGSNTITTVVTSPDGVATKTYMVTVTRAAAGLSTNAVISVLKLTPQTALTLVSGPGNANYTTFIPAGESSLTITQTAQDANATIKVNGVAVASGAASQVIPLSVGNNVITIIATAQDGATTRSYIITAMRAPSAIATLANLALSSGTLSPVFAPATTGYAAIVSNATSSIKLTPTVTDATATIKVNGTMIVSGTATANLPLAVGSNTITTIVTAQDSTTTKTYTATVTRAAAGLSANAVISVIKLTPQTTLAVVSSGSGITNYTTPVPFSESSLTITPTAQDATATIKVNGIAVASGMPSPAIPLGVGDNVITIICTAQDGATTRSYIITATRAPSPIATLANLALSSGTLNPVFASATTGYTDIVPNAISSIKITPTVTDVNATIKVNGTTVASGVASASLPLAIGANTITTVVTAQNGATTQTYTVTLTRAAAGLSTNAVISVLKLTPKTTLTVVSGPGNANYTTPVPFSESSLTITPTAQDATATIKVNGVAVASGTASTAIPLNVGDNVITIIATAQDGATTRSYIITATKAASGPIAQYTPGDALTTDGVTVHQNISPNGDGNSDVLVIDGIAAHPDNKLQIMSRNGTLVYEAKGYDNTTKVFDGHSSTDGKLQQAGTYFYSLDYHDGNEVKHKTGFIILRY